MANVSSLSLVSLTLFLVIQNGCNKQIIMICESKMKVLLTKIPLGGQRLQINPKSLFLKIIINQISDISSGIGLKDKSLSLKVWFDDERNE